MASTSGRMVIAEKNIKAKSLCLVKDNNIHTHVSVRKSLCPSGWFSSSCFSIIGTLDCLSAFQSSVSLVFIDELLRLFFSSFFKNLLLKIFSVTSFLVFFFRKQPSL